MTIPPYRIEHALVDYRTSTNPNNIKDTSASAAGVEASRGSVGGVGMERVKGHGKSVLALELQVTWPEDLESTEGRLVETVLSERGDASISSRVQALKVCACVCRAREWFGRKV